MSGLSPLRNKIDRLKSKEVTDEEQPVNATGTIWSEAGATMSAPPGKITRGWNIGQDREDQNELSWIHVPQEGGIHMIITCSEPVWYSSHWADGRMRPCTGAACSWCHLRVGSQDRVVLSIYLPSLQKSALIEFGFKPGQQLRKLLGTRRSLRGLAVYAYHEHNNPRGKIILTPSDCLKEATDQLPTGPDNAVILPPELDLEEALRQNWLRLGQTW